MADPDAIDQEILVCTLGMFIIDEIHFDLTSQQYNDYGSREDAQSSQQIKHSSPEGMISGVEKEPRVLTNIMGGAGSYTVLGARIVAGEARARSVGWIVDCGSDFPAHMKEQIGRWRTSCLFRQTPERLTTRGWNGYGAGEQRAFKYLTPKLRLDETSLTPQLLSSRSFHLICSPGRCQELVSGIMAKRKEASVAKRPLFIWEPVPDLCTLEEWTHCQAALQVIDVVSPNHVELAGFFGKSEDEVKHTKSGLNRATVEELAQTMVGISTVAPRRNPHVVIRCGTGGCCVVNGLSGKITWLPTYHDKNSSKVVDPTGAGNTFLGGVSLALADHRSIEAASAYGSIVSAVAIEQVGMPDLQEDRWNGLSFKERCDHYQRKLEILDVELEL